MRSYANTEVELRQALRDLGDTSNHVADTLISLGCNGHAGDEKSCPLARFIEQTFEVDYTPGLDPDGEQQAPLMVGSRDIVVRLVGAGWVEVDTTDAVEDFITSFDDGSYAELDGELVA